VWATADETGAKAMFSRKAVNLATTILALSILNTAGAGSQGQADPKQELKVRNVLKGHTQRPRCAALSADGTPNDFLIASLHEK
jgi:hypothetical protein